MPHTTGGNDDIFTFQTLILPFYVPSAISFIGSGMVLPLLALFARTVGATVAEASFIVGLFGLGSFLANIPAGVLVTRFGKRMIIIVATSLEGLIAAILGFTQDVWFLSVFVFLLGAVHTVFVVSRLACFRSLVPKSSRGRALVIIGGESRFGQFLGPMVGGLLAETLGFRYAFWAFAACMAVSVVFLIKWVPHDVDDGDSQQDNRALNRIGAILKENTFIFATAGVSVIILQLLRTARQALLPLVGESIGLTASQVGFVIGMMYLMELVLFYPTGIIMDRFGRKVTAVPAFVLLALGISLLPLARSFPVLIILAILAGFGNGLTSGLNMTLSTDYAPPTNPSEFIGVWRFIVDAGTTSGPILVGAVAAALSLSGAALIIGTIGLAGSAVFAFLVPEPLSETNR